MQKEFEFDGQTYIVKKPGAVDIKDAEIHEGVVYGELIEGGVKTKAYLNNMSGQDKTEYRYQKKQDKINQIRKKIARGGYSKLEARKDAIEAFKMQTEVLLDMSQSNVNKSAEDLSAKAYDEFIMHRCCLDKDGKLVYDSPLKYVEAKDSELAEKFYEELQSLRGDAFTFDSFEEVKFLKKYGYMNDDYQLINEHGQIVDEDFNVVEEEEFTEFTD